MISAITQEDIVPAAIGSPRLRELAEKAQAAAEQLSQASLVLDWTSQRCVETVSHRKVELAIQLLSDFAAACIQQVEGGVA